VHLSSQTNALLGNADGVVTILDDDHPTSATPQLSVSDGTIYEGGSKPTTFSFTLSLSRRPSMTGSVQYQVVGGTATGGIDFVGKAGAMNFTATTFTKVLTVKILTDFVTEPNETFTLVLSKPTNLSIAKGTGTATILNDD
jgi:hypothetical protein